MPKLKAIKQKDKQPRPRYHISKNIQKIPNHLFFQRYISELSSHNNFDRLVSLGSTVSTLDLRFWEEILDTIHYCIDQKFHIEEINASNHPEVNDILIQSISSITSLTNLNISHCRNLRNYSSLKLSSNLNILDLSNNSHLQDSDLLEIVSNLSWLAKLDVSSCPALTDKFLNQLPNLNSSINHLNISNNTNYTHNGIYQLISPTDQFKHVDISNCKNITFFGLVIKDEYSGMVQYVSKSIETLKAYGCPLQKQSIEWICSALSNLQELDLSGTNNNNNNNNNNNHIDGDNNKHKNIVVNTTTKSITNSHLIALISTSMNIKILNLSSCKAVNTEIIQLLARNCPQLADLNIYSCSLIKSTAIAQLLHRCECLTSLDVSHNAGVDDGAFVALASHHHHQHHNNNNNHHHYHYQQQQQHQLKLRKLRLSGCTQLTSTGLSYIASRCPQLELLDLANNPNINDQGILLLSNMCTKLTELNLYDNLKLTDQSINQLCDKCKNLRLLNIGTSVAVIDAWGTRVRQYSDVTLISILKYLKRLKELNLQNQCGIHMTHPWLLPPSSTTPSTSSKTTRSSGRRGFSGHFCLEKLDLRGVDEVSVEGAEAVLSRCYSLQSVQLPGLQDSTNEGGLISQQAMIAQLGSIASIPKEALTPAQRILWAKRYDLRLKEFWMRAFGWLPYVRGNDVIGYNGLQTNHIDTRLIIWQTRDCYYERRIKERWAVFVIATCFRLNKIRRKVIKNVLEVHLKKNTFWKLKLLQRKFEYLKLERRHRAARLIQKKYRKLLFPKILAVKRIQRNYRHHLRYKAFKYRDRYVESAVLIQKIMRGVLVRMSDRHILAQIYVKLPPFWRDILNSAPRKLGRIAIDLEQITQLREQTGDMVAHIIHDIAKDGVLASELPVCIPQPFDKQPYVSLGDGRKMAFYSDKDGLVNKPGVSSIHTYNVTFWPLTKPSTPPDVDTTIHNPSLDGFQVPRRKPDVVLCVMCETRMRAIWCKLCSRGFCFVCAFRVHSDPTRRNHPMEIKPPRDPPPPPAASLVQHIQSAQKTTFDLRYIIKNLRSAAEIKRVQQERRLALEMEKEQRKRDLEAQKALKVEKKKHDAQTQIACVFRCKKAMKAVEARRHHKQLHDARESNNLLHNATIMIQRNFRKYSTRKWFIARGVKFNLNRLKRRKRKPGEQGQSKISGEDLSERINKEVLNRRITQREALQTKLMNQYIEALEILNANIEHWLKFDKQLPDKIEKLTKRRDELHSAYKEAETNLSKARVTATLDELNKMDTMVRALHEQSKSMTVRLDCMNNQRWWISQILRASYRRRCVLKDRFADSLRAIEWVVVESALVRRVTMFMQKLLEQVEREESLTAAANWLRDYIKYTVSHQKTLDLRHEVLIQEETTKLHGDAQRTLEFDRLMEELASALYANAQYVGERIYLDYKGKFAELGSDDAVEFSEKALILKTKENQLSDSVIDNLKLALETRLNDEDEANLDVAGFPTDSPDFKPEDMINITAELFERFRPEKHCRVIDFIKIILVQPWMAIQAVNDIQLEDEVFSKTLELDKANTKYRGFENTIKLCGEKIATISDQMVELELEIDVLETPDNELLPEENEKRKQTAAFLQKELNRKAAEKESLSVLKERTENIFPQIQNEVEEINNDINQLKEQVQKQTSERKSVVALFFQVTDGVVQDVHDQTVTALKQLDKDIEKMTDRLMLCEMAAISEESDDFLRVLRDVDLSLDERITYNRPKYDQTLDLQRRIAVSHPKLTTGVESYLSSALHAQALWLACSSRVLGAVHDELVSERETFGKFKHEKKNYEGTLEQFLELQLQQRRQRSLQRELEERRMRLDELRDTRLKMLQDQKSEKEILEAEKEAKRKAKALESTIAKKIGQNMKKNLRKAADAYRRMKYSNQYQFSEEEERMAHQLRRKNKTTGTLEGIRSVKFTVGESETNLFQRQNQILFEKGLPYYRQMRRSIGIDGSTFIWVEPTYDINEQITTLELSHSDPKNQFHKDLRSFGYVAASHPLLKLVIWTKADSKKESVIVDVMMSLNEKEENKMAIDGHARCIENLTEFGLPDAYLWLRSQGRDDLPALRNVAAVKHELENLQKMKELNPGDTHMLDLEEKLKEKLRDIHEEEVKAEVTDPVKYAVDLLALTESELQSWMKIFENIDRDKSGRVSLDQIFDYFHDFPLTDVHQHLFRTLESCGPDGKVEFGDFLRTCGVFGMFGVDEMLRFLYTYADKTGAGVITTEDYINLLNILYPYDKTIAKSTLHQMGLKAGKRITYLDFVRMNKQYPNAVYPGFKFQIALRLRTMGESWWQKKMRKYGEVRDKMKVNKTNADEAARVEMSRVERDEEREKRMKERDLRIRQEPSAIKRVLMNARQVMDEFS